MAIFKLRCEASAIASGVQIATLWRDPNNGAYGAVVNTPLGLEGSSRPKKRATDEVDDHHSVGKRVWQRGMFALGDLRVRHLGHSAHEEQRGELHPTLAATTVSIITVRVRHVGSTATSLLGATVRRFASGSE